MSKNEGRRKEGRRRRQQGGDRKSWIVCFVGPPRAALPRTTPDCRRGIRKVGRDQRHEIAPRGDQSHIQFALISLFGVSTPSPENHVPFHAFCSFIHSVYSVAASSFSPPLRRPFEFELSLSNVPLLPQSLSPSPSPHHQCAPRSIPSIPRLKVSKHYYTGTTTM